MAIVGSSSDLPVIWRKKLMGGGRGGGEANDKKGRSLKRGQE